MQVTKRTTRRDSSAVSEGSRGHTCRVHVCRVQLAVHQWTHRPVHVYAAAVAVRVGDGAHLGVQLRAEAIRLPPARSDNKIKSGHSIRRRQIRWRKAPRDEEAWTRARVRRRAQRAFP